MPRFLLFCLLFAASLGAFAEAASARTILTGSGAATYQRVITHAHAPTPAGEQGVENTGCPAVPGAGGCTGSLPCLECIYVQHGAGRFTFAHELGHRFDALLMNPGSRNRFRTLTGHRNMPWLCDELSGETCLGRPTAGELFADAYAACLLGWRVEGRRLRNGGILSHWETGYGYFPSPRQHRRVCAMIRKVGR